MAAGWNRKLIAYSVGGVIVLVVVAVVAYFVLFGNSPDEVSLESAVNSAQSASTTTQTGTGSSGATGSIDGIAGKWVVDTSIGDFSFEDATSSFVGFRIKEQLATIGATEAVGRTPSIDGSLTIEGSTVTAVSLTADMTDIVTNNSQRNSRVQSALSTSEFPTANFTLTRPFDIPASLSDGDQFSVSAVGDLTIVGVTNEIEIPLEAQVVGDLVVVVGSVDLSFDDWNVSVPSAPVVVSAADHGLLEMQLFFARA